MVKMAASLLLILGGAGIGYARSREITEREKNLEILLQILFFLKGEIRCGNSSLPDAFREIAAKISGFFGTILRDAAQEMEDTGGKNLEEIMEFCIQRNFYQGNPGGSQRKEEMEILRTLGRRLGYLDREMQIKQIELLETDVEEQRRQLREKMPEQKKICQSLGIMGAFCLQYCFGKRRRGRAWKSPLFSK